MATTVVTITGLDELNAVMQQLPTQLGQLFHAAGSTYTETVYKDSQKVVPVRTGRLKRSGGFGSTQDSEDVYYNAPYANYVERRRHYFYDQARTKEPQMLKLYATAIGTWLASRLKP